MKYLFIFFISINLYAFEVGDQFNILRQPNAPSNQHMQPSLNPWTVTSTTADTFEAESNGVTGTFEYIWGSTAPDPFFDEFNPIDNPDNPDTSSLYLTVSGNGHYIPPTINVGTPTDSHTVTQNPDGTIVTVPNTGQDNDPTLTDPNDNNSTFGNLIPNYQALIDQDNDVPMLTNIYDRLATLDQDSDASNLLNIANQIIDTRGLMQLERRDIGEQTRLSDIEYNLRQLELEQKAIRGEILDENGSTTGQFTTLTDVVNAINSQGSDTNVSFDPASQGNSQQAEYSEQYTALSNSAKKAPTVNLGQSPGFMDAPAEFTLKGNSVKLALLDPSASYGSLYTAKLAEVLPSRSEIFLFIKRAILIIIFGLYYYYNYRLLFATTDTLIKSNESNTVSNYSIFGVNIGGPALKSVKLGVWALFAGGIGFTTIVGLADSGITFDLGANDQGMITGDSANTSIVESIAIMLATNLAGIADWANASVSLFLDVFPLTTMVSAVTTYYANSLLIYGAIFAMNRASRTAS